MIDLAESFSLKQGINPSYLLSNKSSCPHVSVFQFEVQDDSQDKLLQTIWETAEEMWQKVLLQQAADVFCHLYPQVNYKHDLEGLFSGVTWVVKES